MKFVLAIVLLVVLTVGAWKLADNRHAMPSAPSQQPSTAPANSDEKPAPGAVTIKHSHLFTPSQITVQKGATVTWTNEDTDTHTVVDDLSDAGGPASADIVPGGTYSFTFTKTGSFQYHCSLHPDMRGTIVVK